VQDLDLLGGQGIDRDGVIRIGRGEVEAADPVDQDRRAVA